MTKAAGSRDRILETAKKEFLEKGFTNASLRQIVKEAGVTTGSFYWHFKNKEELFDAIAGEHYRYIMGLYTDYLKKFTDMSHEEQKKHVGDIGKDCIAEMIEYIYRYKSEFHILIDCSAGTKYEGMLHEIAEAEIRSTHMFADHMRELGMEIRDIDPELEHILVSGMFAGLFELITHDVPLDKARKCAGQLHDFYTAGWMSLMNIH